MTQKLKNQTFFKKSIVFSVMFCNTLGCNSKRVPWSDPVKVDSSIGHLLRQTPLEFPPEFTTVSSAKEAMTSQVTQTTTLPTTTSATTTTAVTSEQTSSTSKNEVDVGDSIRRRDKLVS